VIGLEDDIRSSMERAAIFGAFLNELTRPMLVMLWLERAADELERQRETHLPPRDSGAAKNRPETDNG